MVAFCSKMFDRLHLSSLIGLIIDDVDVQFTVLASDAEELDRRIHNPCLSSPPIEKHTSFAII